MESSKFDIDLGKSSPEIRKLSEQNFITFWESEAKSLSWFKRWDSVLEWKPPFSKWFKGGLINASFNTLDIHQKKKSDK